eukprot:scaffold3941_cov412-Prasinococcus_capsulatus_cf.AAC.21
MKEPVPDSAALSALRQHGMPATWASTYEQPRSQPRPVEARLPRRMLCAAIRAEAHVPTLVATKHETGVQGCTSPQFRAELSSSRGARASAAVDRRARAHAVTRPPREEDRAAC